IKILKRKFNEVIMLIREYESILKKLERWENGGIKILDNGAKLICHTPHIAPKAWLHEIYAKIENHEIDEIEKKLNVKLPEDLISFLKCSNGINIFSDSLSIWGFRSSYVRRGSEVSQPYDLIALNQERKGEMPENWLIFGSYSWDGSLMLYDLGQGNSKVYRCDNNAEEIIQEWDSIWSWLSIEVERLSQLFDSKGIKHDRRMPTIP
ncbi:MAG: SMI1/KNR4 family protein, partial [Bacillota bacterium]